MPCREIPETKFSPHVAFFFFFRKMLTNIFIVYEETCYEDTTFLNKKTYKLT